MRNVLTWVATAAILSAAGSALAANQYDLTCKGTEQKETGKPATPWAETFRIDLDAKRWCRGDCRTAARIDAVTPDEIVISNSRATSGGPNGTALSFPGHPEMCVSTWTQDGRARLSISPRASARGVCSADCRARNFDEHAVITTAKTVLDSERER